MDWPSPQQLQVGLAFVRDTTLKELVHFPAVRSWRVTQCCSGLRRRWAKRWCPPRLLANEGGGRNHMLHAKQRWLLFDWLFKVLTLREETWILKKLTGAVESFLKLTCFKIIDVDIPENLEKREKKSAYKAHRPKRTHWRASCIRRLSTHLSCPFPAVGSGTRVISPLQALIFWDCFSLSDKWV